LALHARLSERAYTYERNRSPHPRAAKADVSFDNEASASATVVDVRATDRIGVLYRITRAFGELDLDIRSARIQTLGAQVIDSFYLRSNRGAKITEPTSLAEIERAILHSVAD
jgi:[protein-PII] uridylyltransferase